MSDRVQALKGKIKELVMPLSKMRAISMTKDMSADRELVADNIANELTSKIISFLASQRLGWAEKLKLPYCDRFNYFDLDACERKCDFELMKSHCPLSGAVRFVPLEIGDDKIY